MASMFSIVFYTVLVNSIMRFNVIYFCAGKEEK